VAALGFLLLVSLVISAAISALTAHIDTYLPFGHVILDILNFLISFVLISVLFAAIYKVLPDKDIGWRDVLVGAIATTFLFSVGKFLIGLYIGSSAVASSYGAAAALIVVLLWIYYSAQIFLLGAEFTKVYSRHYGSQARVSQAAQVNQTGRQAASGFVAGSARPTLPARRVSPAWNLLTAVLVIAALLPERRSRR
jgi:membrane protein